MKRLLCVLPELRAKHGRMTLTELSRRTGIAASTLSKLETRKTKGIDFETVEKLCDLFQIAPGDLFRLVEPEELDRSFELLAAMPATLDVA